MMRLVPFALVTAAMALAACSPPPPREDTAGAAARKQVDASTKSYADCIVAATKSIDVSGENAGTLALTAMKSCAAQRTALIGQVAAFHKLGHPTETPALATAVAEASVQTIEDDLRQQAVVTVVQRQTPADRAKVNP